MKVLNKLALFSLLLATNLYADTVLLNAQNQLIIPSVSVADKMYAVSLELLANSSPMQFQLLNPVYGEVLSQAPSADFSNNVLTINQVMVGNALYNANLKLIADNPFAFELQHADLICQDCALEQGIDGSHSLFSTAFVDGGSIPLQYSCEGSSVSPALTWTPGAAGTVTYSIILDDPDAISVAGFTWVHMNLYNLPSSVNTLAEGINSANLPETAAFGPNDNGNLAYDGPCPPPGHGDHNYHWRVYAMDSVISVPAAAMTRAEFESLYADKILGASYLLKGIFAR